jgi:hypothetical protein
MLDGHVPPSGFGFGPGGGGGGMHHMSNEDAQQFFSSFFGNSDPFSGGMPGMSFQHLWEACRVVAKVCHHRLPP